jgi:hypothetical protein
MSKAGTWGWLRAFAAAILGVAAGIAFREMVRDKGIIIASAFAAVIAGLALWALWWLWWRLPQRQVARLTLQIPDPKARADVEDNFRKTVGQALGGAAVSQSSTHSGPDVRLRSGPAIRTPSGSQFSWSLSSLGMGPWEVYAATTCDYSHSCSPTGYQ